MSELFCEDCGRTLTVGLRTPTKSKKYCKECGKERERKRKRLHDESYRKRRQKKKSGWRGPLSDG